MRRTHAEVMADAAEQLIQIQRAAILFGQKDLAMALNTIADDLLKSAKETQ